MISNYLTDICDIYSYSIDEWGVKTETIDTDVKCRVEDFNRLIKNDKGQEVLGSMEIIFDSETSIDRNSKIVIKTKSGVNYDLSKKFEIQKLSSAAMFVKTHIEVIV